jgi:hypothetical protein
MFFADLASEVTYNLTMESVLSTLKVIEKKVCISPCTLTLG